MKGRQKLSRFIAYCADEIVAEIESKPRYKVGDWDIFETSLKNYFFKKEADQREYQMAFLRVLVERQRNEGDEDVQGYCSQFKRISEQLMARNGLSQYSAVAELFGGLSEELQIEVQRNIEKDFFQSDNLEICAIIKELLSIEDSKNERLMIVQSAGGPVNPDIQNLFLSTTPASASAQHSPRHKCQKPQQFLSFQH